MHLLGLSHVGCRFLSEIITHRHSKFLAVFTLFSSYEPFTKSCSDGEIMNNYYNVSLVKNNFIDEPIVIKD